MLHAIDTAAMASASAAAGVAHAEREEWALAEEMFAEAARESPADAELHEVRALVTLASL